MPASGQARPGRAGPGMPGGCPDKSRVQSCFLYVQYCSTCYRFQTNQYVLYCPDFRFHCPNGKEIREYYEYSYCCTVRVLARIKYNKVRYSYRYMGWSLILIARRQVYSAQQCINNLSITTTSSDYTASRGRHAQHIHWDCTIDLNYIPRYHSGAAVYLGLSEHRLRPKGFFLAPLRPRGYTPPGPNRLARQAGDSWRWHHGVHELQGRE